MTGLATKILLACCASYVNVSQTAALSLNADESALFDKYVNLSIEPDEESEPGRLPKLQKADESFIDAELQADFHAKSAKLKVLMQEFMEAKREMEEAKAIANQAMHKVKEEAEKRRKIAAAKKAKEDAELAAKVEARRKAKEEMMAKARLIAGPAFGSVSQLLGDLTVENLVDVLITLPSAIQDETFMNSFHQSTKEVKSNVKAFTNITQKKTSAFVSSSTSASDVELAFLMAKFFHESGYRLKALHKDTEKIIKDLRFTVPDNLKMALGPILTQLKANTVPLKVNATSLAAASPAEACDLISGIMSNISDYDSKLGTVTAVLQNITATMLPDMSKVMHVSPNVTYFVGSFLNMAQLEVAGLQEASHDIVVKVGPIISERIQCTWSAAPSLFGLHLVAAAISMVAGWLLL